MVLAFRPQKLARARGQRELVRPEQTDNGRPARADLTKRAGGAVKILETVGAP